MDEKRDQQEGPTLIEYMLSQLEPGSTLLEPVLKLAYQMSGEDGGWRLLRALGARACVVDTNVLLNDLRRAIRTEAQTALLESAKIGHVRLYASTKVRAETFEKIAKKASVFNWDAAAVRRHWETEYVPWITFVDPSALPPLSERVVALSARDPDDVPTGQIIELVRPHSVLSADKDLSAFGPVAKDWTFVTVAYRDQARKAVMEVHLQVGGGLVLRLSVATIEALLRGAIRLVSGINRKGAVIALATIAILAGICVAYRSARERVQRNVRLAIDAAKQGAERLAAGLETTSEGYARLARQADEADLILAKVTQSPSTDIARQIARDYAALVLGTSPIPLTGNTITRGMIAEGYLPRGEHPERYVSRVLHQHHDLFEQDASRRWRFKSHGPSAR